MDLTEIIYHFKFPETKEETISYKVQLDKKTNSYHSSTSSIESGVPAKNWILLKNNKCTNCTLDEKEHEECPIAKNLNCIVSYFKDVKSYKKSMIFVETSERSYAKSADVQEGLFSLFGLVMATSNCPVMSFLKPMARFHLPFSTIEETFYRSASTHLLIEYLKKSKNKEKKELNLVKLVADYKEVEVVNTYILKRISSIAQGDADKNALIILDNFSQYIQSEIDTDAELSTLSEIFDI